MGKGSQNERIDVRKVAARAAARALGGTAGDASADLVTATCLEGYARGDTLCIRPDARVTPLAADEARRRGVRIVVSATPGALHASLGGASLVIAIGADHGGFELKQALCGVLTDLGHRAKDLGTHDTGSVDYPDFAQAVAEEVARGAADLGVCVDGAGIGSAMTAGKVPGILAATCWNEASARNAREHNHANVLCLGAGFLEPGPAAGVLNAFLTTGAGAGRHARRVDKIRALERRHTREVETR